MLSTLAFNIWTGLGEKAIPHVVLPISLNVGDTVYIAQVAQLVEQRTENPRVGGSNPPLGTTSQDISCVNTL